MTLQDERWARVEAAVERIDEEANAELERICEAEGIPEGSAPCLCAWFLPAWHDRTAKR